jgi:hypothetical protein
MQSVPSRTPRGPGQHQRNDQNHSGAGTSGAISFKIASFDDIAFRTSSDVDRDDQRDSAGEHETGFAGSPPGWATLAERNQVAAQQIGEPATSSVGQ